MRRWPIKFLAITGLALALATLAHADETQFFSTVTGTGFGGLIGSSIGHGDGRAAATGAGVILGGAIGNEAGRPSYDRYSYPTYYGYGYVAPSYPYAPYQPNYVTPPSPPPQPPSTYIDDQSGAYCREFSQAERIGNQVRESFGTACLQPDGSWHIVQ